MENRFVHGNMVCSSFSEFKLSLPETQNVDNDHYLSSKPIFTDVYRRWTGTAYCFPRLGRGEWDNAEYVSLFVRFFFNNGRACSTTSRAEAGGENNSTGAVSFLLQAFVVGADADADADADAVAVSVPSRHRATKPKFFRYSFGRTDDLISGWRCFVKRSDLESLHAANGVVTIVFGLLFLPDNDSVTTIPTSSMTKDLGRMLDCGDGSDVSFLVGGETFLAHRGVLAARSPVFRAELFGSMEEANMPCITLQDIEPEVFKLLLLYMYTDIPPPPHDSDDGDDLGSSTELFRRVLAAADRYALDRLKLMCAQRLCEVLSIDTVVATLGCAETHSCPELKKRCLDFFMEEKNFKKIVVTESYLQLMQSFPSVINEIKERIQT